MPMHYSKMTSSEATNILSVDYGNLFSTTHLKHLFNKGADVIAYPDTSNVDVSFKNLINATAKPSRTIEDRCHIESELLILLTSMAKSIRMYSESNLSYIKQAILYVVATLYESRQIDKSYGLQINDLTNFIKRILFEYRDERF